MKQEPTKTQEIGYVIASRDYLIYVEGLPSVHLNDIIEGAHGEQAIVTALRESKITAVLLTASRAKPGDQYRKRPEGLTIYDPLSLLGRSMNPLGTILDDGPKLTSNPTSINLEPPAWGISRRVVLSEQLITGVSLIDTLLPIGKGQRQLFFGEPTSGKTPLVLDLIINQRTTEYKPEQELPRSQTICIYAAIGKAEIEVKRYIELMKQHQANHYTIVIAAFSGEPAPIITITPSLALSIAERLRDQGYSSVVILDDLGTHAKYLREIALLSERVPGRESYPGDIFFQQAYLTERAGNFNVEGFDHPVAITLLPLIETSLENFSSLIPTNIMATTDGHVLFSASLRSEGRYPSIDLDRSVTRVGRQTQTHIFHELSDKLRLLMTEYQELKTYSRFGADTTNITLQRGELLYELLRQQQLQRISLPAQMIYLSLVFTNFFIGKDSAYIRKNKDGILRLIHQHPDFLKLQQAINTLKLSQVIQTLDQDPYRTLLIAAKGTP